MNKTRIFNIFFTLIATACTNPTVSQTNHSPVGNTTPQPPARVTNTTVEGMNQFGLDIYQRIASNSTDDIVLSPASLSVAFGMTAAGARGATAVEMGNVLHIAPNDPQTHRAFGQLLQSWNAPRNTYELRSVNRIYAERSWNWNSDFLGITQNDYHSGLEQVNFVTAADNARIQINDWVAQQTAQKIRDLLPEGSLDTNTRMVLTNAIYFKGRWQRQFRTQDSRPQPFFMDGRQTQAMMMNQSGTFNTGEVENVRVLEMPYVGDDLSMVIVLPNQRNGLPNVERTLNTRTVTQWLSSLHSTEELDVSIPRFRVASPSLSLRDTLSQLGMASAFAPGADFTGMSAQRPLFISNAFHKAFIEVNEEGSEAAAATAVVMATESAHIGPTPFVADHPFLFMIRDRHSGAVMFIGRVTGNHLSAT